MNAGDLSPIPAITDPAAAIAAAQCYLARTWGQGGSVGIAVTERHPRECQWCPYPIEQLVRLIVDFNAWAFDGRGKPRDQATAAFLSKPTKAQRAAVHLALYDEELTGQDGTTQTRTAL